MTIEINRIYNENCTETMARMPDGFVDLVVTSPPYDTLDKDLNPIVAGMRKYNGYSWDFKSLAHGLYRVMKDGGVAVWVVTDKTENGTESLTSFRQALYFKDDCGFNVETMIYKQMGTGAKGSNYYYWQSFEYMFILAKGQPKTSNRIRDKKNVKAGSITGSSPKNQSLHTRGNGRVITVGEYGIRENVWTYPAHQGDITEHPAPFPERLASDHIISWSNEGDLVYDPFMGSGTTAKMAIINNRNYIGSEISAEYCEIARKRIDRIDGGQSRLL